MATPITIKKKPPTNMVENVLLSIGVAVVAEIAGDDVKYR